MGSRVRRAVGAGLLALGLAGCPAGPDSLTSETVPAVAGLNVDDGGIGLRTVAIPYFPGGYPAGGAMPITMVVFNDTEQPVSLAAAASPGAATVTTGEGDGVAVPATGYLDATVTLVGLREEVQAFDIVPLELVFDNGATFQLEVPVAPPPERVGEREPIIEPEAH